MWHANDMYVVLDHHREHQFDIMVEIFSNLVSGEQTAFHRVLKRLQYLSGLSRFTEHYGLRFRISPCNFSKLVFGVSSHMR